jgi:hypothetical protein
MDFSQIKAINYVKYALVYVKLASIIQNSVIHALEIVCWIMLITHVDAQSERLLIVQILIAHFAATSKL